MARINPFIPSDPLFHLQWHLYNQGNTPGSVAGYDINVISVWPDYTGKGTLIGVMDQGMDDTHPDLVHNYRPELAWDVYLNEPGATVREPRDMHGVAVAGLASASGNNGIGGVGVAWESDFTMYRSPFFDDDEIEASPPPIEEDLLLSFQRAAERKIAHGVDVSINSWSPGISLDHQLLSDYHAVGRDMAALGRDGLGISTVVSAGNSRLDHMDTNHDPFTNSPWAIVVAASDQAGNVALYSTAGASVLVAAPGSANPASMVTTDRQGEAGYNPEPDEAGDYTDRGESFFAGTSAAAPVAGGVVALVLEANAGLGYRDIQEILAYSSKRATFLDRDLDYAFNGARDWNGGALLASHDVGYGHINAHAAVRLAESWMKTSTVSNLVLEQGQINERALTLEGGQEGALTAHFAPDYRVEQMAVTVTLEAGSLEHFTIALISPDGMVSRLMDLPTIFEGSDDDEEDGDDEDDDEALVHTLTTVLNWGADLAGEWTLRVTNAEEGETFELSDWSLLAYTAGDAGGDTQIFTDEFGRFSDLQPERSTIDAVDGSTLNAAAVTDSVRFDLAGGPSRLGDTELTLSDPNSFLHLVSGDGDDILIGNAAENILMAGRGNNHVDGGAGLDVVRLIGESSAYTVEAQEDWVTVYSHGLSGGGMDVLYNIELLHFADQVKLTSRPIGLEADLFDEAGYLGQNPDVAAAVSAGEIGSGRDHYEQWGTAEGRNPNNLFSEAWYLGSNADVAQAVNAGELASGFAHYQSFGWVEGRTPSAWMDTSAYLAANSDVAAAQMNPLQHYLLHGVHEGRSIMALDVDMWA